MSSTLESVGPQGASQYVLGARIPAIGHEEVYLAERIAPPELRGPVIIKLARRSKPHFPALREKIVDEALENASFSHSNLTAVADMVENDEGVYLVFENVAGTNLHAVNAALRGRQQAMSFELSAYIALEMLKGIHHLHTARGPSGERKTITIRDITPAQVLLSSSGQVKIANRGLSAALGPVMRQTPAELVAYYAPERIAGEPFSIRSDLYVVGVMLFELLTGRPCFPGRTKDEVLTAIVTRGVQVGELHGVEIPQPMINVLERSTAFVPERRYTSAVDMARDLEQWIFENAPRQMARVAARFLEMQDFSSPMSDLEKGSGAANALVPTSLDQVALAGLESMAARPEFAALFGDRMPSPRECACFATALEDGLTVEEAEAMATRPVLRAEPRGPSGPGWTAPSQPPQAQAQPVPAPPPEIVLALPPEAAQVDEPKVGSKRWWRETILIVVIILVALAANMLFAAFDHDQDRIELTE